MRRWLGSKTSALATRSPSEFDEVAALEEALAAAAHILNDDIELADEELRNGTSPFHKLGLAMTSFLRGVLSFEKESLETAAQRLNEAEESTLEYQRRAVRDPTTSHRSTIYPPGSEYALMHAESQLMNAVVGVMTGGLSESLKGAYKLRKAFNTLYEISQAEEKYLVAKGYSRITRASSVAVTKGHGSGLSTVENSAAATPISRRSVDGQAKILADGSALNEYEDDLDTFDMSKLKEATTGLDDTAKPPSENDISSTGVVEGTEEDIDFRTITQDPIDLFIHSGTALCFGVFQLLLSMIPPAFARILSLFSFRGDRSNGIRLLWSATKIKTNVNGAFAGLILLGFRNGAIAFCDILKEDELPVARLNELLREMRSLYPKSRMWLLEEARMYATNRELERAVKIIDDCGVSPLKQLQALQNFERSLDLMYLHRYEECSKSFLKTIELSNWSHGEYYYIAGSAYVELYRMAKSSDPEKAKEYASKAEELLKKVPSHAGKKRFMGRQLPVDLFILRKISKWTARAEERKIPFVEAIGVSPIEESTYFWCGYKRMSEAQLEFSLQRLAWSEDQPGWTEEREDEKAIHATLKATCLRFLGRASEAKSLLTSDVFCHELAKIKACPHPDTWTLPVGHYEMAVCLWVEAGEQEAKPEDLRKCSEELAITEGWESYDLEPRHSLKVTTARSTLKKCGVTA